LRLIAKPFFMRGSKALRFGIRLFSAGTIACALALLLSASYAPNDLTLASFAPKKASRSGAGLCRTKPFGLRTSVATACNALRRRVLQALRFKSAWFAA